LEVCSASRIAPSPNRSQCLIAIRVVVDEPDVREAGLFETQSLASCTSADLNRGEHLANYAGTGSGFALGTPHLAGNETELIGLGLK
jgi:hypothetical protein